MSKNENAGNRRVKSRLWRIPAVAALLALPVLLSSPSFTRGNAGKGADARLGKGYVTLAKRTFGTSVRRPGSSPAETPRSLPLTMFPLNDLSGFLPTSSNWKIVGNVYADRHTPNALEGRLGKGILGNFSDSTAREHLFTRLQHGDIELEAEVLMAKGSNSGIYLQGRYELQLLDSWGKDEVRYSDIGGVYQRTDPATGKGYEGHAPLVNASKAPGLWQKLRILFRAPRFDNTGKKVANACFLKVYLNGVLIQDSAEVSGPTRSAAFTDEQPLGPLMIQGNHGRVALRNIAYKLYDLQQLAVRDLYYREYASPGKYLKDPPALSPVKEQETDSISRYLAGGKETFLMLYQGTFEFPRTGDYLFRMQAGGGGALLIEGDTVISHEGEHAFEEEAFGKYRATSTRVPFTLIYNKPIQWRQGFALYAEGPGMAWQPLHASGSVPYEPPVDPILIGTESGRAVIQRSFTGSGGDKKTHCLSVGTPEGVHFTVDLETGGLLQVWSGGFLDATPMWHRRGNQQVALPLGPVITFPDVPCVSFDHQPSGQPKFLEYTLDGRGLPSFKYAFEGLEILDKLTPSADGRGLTRKLRISGKNGFLCRLASGSGIEELPDGAYAVNDKEYYLIVGQAAGLQPELTRTGKNQSIFLRETADGAHEFEYTIRW